MKHLPEKIAAAILSGALLAGGIAVVSTVRAGEQSPAKAKSISLVVDDRPLPTDLKLNSSLAPIVKKVAPSVVKIEIKIGAKEPHPFGNQFPNDPFFRQFFGGHQRMFSPPEHGVGSGVIVTKDGYILTNNHVVDDADEVKVSLQDGRVFTAKVIGKDPKSDVAVVKIDANDLPAITFADSDKCEVGDLVLAIGNPFGIDQSVTRGIVSAKDRSAMNLDYEDFIQTDAAINPGNSGGALVDADGRLIGINTAIFSRSGGNQGIGFAIPTDLAKGVMESLIKYGKVTRGYLGVMIQDLNPTLAKEFKLKSNEGALVGDVVPDGPADKAGLKSGDVIEKFDGKPVADSRHLKMEVAREAPGSIVKLQVLRDNSTKTLEVRLKELPGSDKLAQNDGGDEDKSATLQGVGVTDIDSQARQQLNIPAHVKGVLVTQVDPDSAAAEAGLKQGDVIMEINRHEVTSAGDAVRLTEHPKDRTTLLHVWSEKGSRYMVVDETKAG
ncbi:MAG: DegQ family serine endoprotease [Verrucomicrobiota bacterium]